jgi:hypothetical protein
MMFCEALLSDSYACLRVAIYGHQQILDCTAFERVGDCFFRVLIDGSQYLTNILVDRAVRTWVLRLAGAGASHSCDYPHKAGAK